MAKTRLTGVIILLLLAACSSQAPIPVEDEEERIVGVISRRDFNKIKKTSQMNSPVKAFMSRNIMALEPGADVIQAARLMVKHDIGRLPIMSDGKLIGIVTRSDAMRYFYDLEAEGSVPQGRSAHGLRHQRRKA